KPSGFTDAEWTDALRTDLGFERFFRVMPNEWRHNLERRAGGQILSREKARHPNTRLKNFKLKLVGGTEASAPQYISLFAHPRKAKPSPRPPSSDKGREPVATDWQAPTELPDLRRAGAFARTIFRCAIPTARTSRARTLRAGLRICWRPVFAS